MIKVREIQMEDSKCFLRLCQELDEETKFRPYDSGERNYDVIEQERRIQATLNSGNSNIFVAVDEAMDGDGGALVGYIEATGLNLNRLRHITRIGVAIKQSHCGQGIGRLLFEALEGWAKANNIHRLELTVMTDNMNAQNLYKKMGFEMEGLKKHSLFIDGEYADDYYMYKLI